MRRSRRGNPAPSSSRRHDHLHGARTAGPVTFTSKQRHRSRREIRIRWVFEQSYGSIAKGASPNHHFRIKSCRSSISPSAASSRRPVQYAIQAFNRLFVSRSCRQFMAKMPLSVIWIRNPSAKNSDAESRSCGSPKATSKSFAAISANHTAWCWYTGPR